MGQANAKAKAVQKARAGSTATTGQPEEPHSASYSGAPSSRAAADDPTVDDQGRERYRHDGRDQSRADGGQLDGSRFIVTTRIYANSSCVPMRISGGGAYTRCGANELKKPIAQRRQDKTLSHHVYLASTLTYYIHDTSIHPDDLLSPTFI